MDRELLIEIGTEELPASWLPALTTELSTQLEAQLNALRLTPAAPVESYSTPRRLTARVAKIAERQADTEEVVTGPSLSAAFADGQPTPAAQGFAKKLGVTVETLERMETAKGSYLAYKRQLRGKAAVDVLPDVLSGLLRELTFPKTMRWDATLEDGRGDLVFGRPIRWILFLYGGRVVPFTIFRPPAAQGPLVQEVRSAAVTFGHRFLTTSGRAGRAIKVKGFDDYRKRLAENFVVLERSERRDRIARELDVEARRRGGRLATALVGQTLLAEVPDLVEYPSVVSGTFPEEFLSLPEEVLTTTMIHHQHFFPVLSDQHKLLPVFLAVLNMEPEKPELIARNLERVLTARLRDARFFWESDRQKPLADLVERLDTVLFHKKLGSYRAKAERVARLARWITEEVFGRPDLAAHAETAGRLSKADLATDMVRELTDLQGTVGGIYARDDGQPEEVWRAIAYHYLPTAVEADAAPSREQLGAGAITWAAVSLADKLDTLVGLFAAGERPTGSRDPYGLRRAAQGIVRVLMYLPELTGVDRSPTLRKLVDAAGELQEADKAARDQSLAFMFERVLHALIANGARVEVARAYGEARMPVDNHDASPLEARRIAGALSETRTQAEFVGLATLFKRVKNIAKDVPAGTTGDRSALRESAETSLARALDALKPSLAQAIAAGKYRDAFVAIAGMRDQVDQFFVDVLVMADDPAVRAARLGLMAELRDLVIGLADISTIVPPEEKAPEKSTAAAGF
jgi:glycyl-tRNA synthetase beta chain